MYDVCDVLNASYSSADVATHALRSYGDGNMGKGIRKLAGEMRTIGGIESYKLGYEAGVSDTYTEAFNDGIVPGIIIGVCTSCIIAFVAWCSKKAIDYYQENKHEPQNSDYATEEVAENV